MTSPAISVATEISKTYVKPESFKIWGLKYEKPARLLALAHTVNLLVPLIFSTFLFANCMTELPAALNITSTVGVASLSIWSLLFLLHVHAKQRLTEAGKTDLPLGIVPHAKPPLYSCIVDSKHAMVIGGQLINLGLASAVGGVVITQQCKIDMFTEPASIGALIIIFHLGYVSLAAAAGGSTWILN